MPDRCMCIIEMEAVCITFKNCFSRGRLGLQMISIRLSEGYTKIPSEVFGKVFVNMSFK